MYHTSVLLKETIEALQVRKGSKYIDATLGGGGHTGEILARGGNVLGIDQDQDAIDYVKANGNLLLAKGNFKDIDRIAREHGFENVAGILFDLGISSHHVDTGTRGFSFQYDAPLDMRMSQELNVTAQDLVNVLSKKDLADLFFKLGEERFSRRIAERIVTARQTKKIETTKELSDLVKRSVPGKKTGSHPATKVFQALRIAVNDELFVLQEALPKALQLLANTGRIAVISFHSLEDRIVKRTFREWEKKGLGKQITKKPIVPSGKEISENTRSRSAKLRVFEKV